jgi:hypothetical protein
LIWAEHSSKESYQLFKQQKKPPVCQAADVLQGLYSHGVSKNIQLPTFEETTQHSTLSPKSDNKHTLNVEKVCPLFAIQGKI